MTDWNRAALEGLRDTKARVFIPRTMAMTEIAVFDALRAIEPRYAAYAYRGTAPAAASDVAAASEAAYRVLAEMTPDLESKFAAVNAKVLSSIPDAAARAAGIEAGDAAAQAILEARRDDRYDASFDYTPLNPVPGVYQKTSPGDVLFPHLFQMRPFALPSATSAQVPPPPPLDSPQFLRDLSEVREVGSAENPQSSEEYAIAKFHEAPGFGPWNDIGRQAVERQNLDLLNSRAIALLAIAIEDANAIGFGTKRPSITWGVLRIGLVAADQESGMKWRILVELAGADGSVQSHEISVGGCGTINSSAETLGLTLAEGKKTLAGLQRHLVQAQTEEHCRNRRRCQRCGAQRPLKDIRRRRLTSLFGVVEVRAPRFGPCRCGVASRRTITPAAEIMPDRCTPEYERTLAKMGDLLPYRRARSLLDEFFPLGDAPEVETIRQRTMRVGARLERDAAALPRSAPTEAGSIALAIDGGHVKSVRSYQVRSFEVFVAQVSNDAGRRAVFSSVPAEADLQQQQLRGVLHRLGATPRTPVTILSDGADGPRSLGEAASVGPTHHVLDCFHLSMRIQHVAQAAKGYHALQLIRAAGMG